MHEFTHYAVRIVPYLSHRRHQGRLRAVLQQGRLEDLYAEMDRQLREGPDLENDRRIVLHLNLTTTVPPPTPLTQTRLGQGRS